MGGPDVAERLGKHRLVRRLAVGGMAEIFLAVTEGLGGFEKRVVCKRLLPQHARDPEVRAMFVDEARLGARLRHPHVTEVFDIGEETGPEGPSLYFTTEHVAGRDLRDVLAARPGPVDLAAALTIVAAVGKGLHHAHELSDEEGVTLGLVHRDVTPSNVLLGWDGAVKLTDFGVAKWAAQRAQTRQGTLKGKCAYMSPEQCRAERLDRTSDVWALGVVLYELLTGTRPFEADSEFEVMRAIVAGGPSPPSQHAAVDPRLEAIVLRALAARREDRFATGLQFAAAIDEAAAGLGLTLGPAAVAALLVERFGAESRAAESAQLPVAAKAAEPGTAPPERTITDVASATAGDTKDMAAQAGPALVQRRAGGGARLWLVAAALVVLGVGGAWLLRSGDSRETLGRAEGTTAPAPPGPVPAPQVRTAPAPSVPAAPEVRATTPVPSMPSAAPVLPAKRARAAKAPRPRPVPAPASKVWDYDSPLPPTP